MAEEWNMLRRLKRREERALLWFIEKYTAYVSTIVSNIIGARMAANDVEEVTADVFFVLWENAAKVRPGKVKAYLGAVARNKAREKLRQVHGELLLEEDVLVISSQEIDRQLEAKEQAELVTKAILRMELPDREIFLRHYYYYQPVRTIAQELGMKESTVKTRLHRGRMKLKDVLKEGGYGVGD